MRVLVAEDKSAMANLLTRALRRDGHSVVVAYDGQEALELGRIGGCDIILLDLMLPHVDGFTILRTLRAERRFTPTLIVSARDEMNDIVQGLNLGADDYLLASATRSSNHQRRTRPGAWTSWRTSCRMEHASVR